MSTFQGQGPGVSAYPARQPVTREKSRRTFQDFWTLFTITLRTFKMSISLTYFFLRTSSSSPPALKGTATLGPDSPPSRRLAPDKSLPDAYKSSVWAASPSKVVACPRITSSSHLTLGPRYHTLGHHRTPSSLTSRERGLSQDKASKA